MMAETKYNSGDILTLCEDGHCYATAVIVNSYMSGYDLFIKPRGNDDFRFIRDVPEMVLCKYEVVGHIDISGMSIKEIKTELVYAIATVWKTVWSEYVIAYAVQTHWELMKLRESKEESEYVKMGFCIPKTNNPFYYDNLADKLAEECKQKQKHLDLANNKILELKKEVDSLRQLLRNDSIRIHKNLGKIGFTEDAICSIMYSEPNDI